MAKMGRPKKLTPDQERIIYDQHKKGKSIVLLAYTYEISVRTVDRVLSKFRLLEAENHEIK